MTVAETTRTAYREALPILLVSGAGGLFAGVILGGMEAELEAIPGLLLLVPALLATRGNVYGSLGARLASALHQGLVDPKLTLADDRIRAAVAAALANGILISALAAVLGFALLVALGRPSASLLDLVTIALVAGVLSGLALTLVVVAVVIVGYRRGLNPDTLAGPVVTTTGDVVGVATLLFAARFALALGGG